MTLQQQAQFKEIRRCLKDAYDDYFKRSDDGVHKSSEMAVEVYYPNYWETDPESPMKACGIGIYSYVLGPSRMHHFDTFDEALTTVREWLREQLAWNPEDDDAW